MLRCLSSGTDLRKSRHVLKSLTLCNKVLSYLSLSHTHIYTHTCKNKVSYLWSNFIHNTIIHKPEKSPPPPHQKQIHFSQKCSYTHRHNCPEGSFQLPAANDTSANASGLPRVDGWVPLGFVVSHLEISEK